MDEVEIIHMNGRVYDYNVGRFLSVDPFIQGVGNSQGINPYSYVMNNPLGYTDPSGYQSQMTTQCSNRSASAFSSCLFFSEVGITFGGEVIGSGTDYVYNGVSAERGPLKTNVSINDIESEQSAKQQDLGLASALQKTEKHNITANDKAGVLNKEEKAALARKEQLLRDMKNPEVLKAMEEARVKLIRVYQNGYSEYDDVQIGIAIYQTPNGEILVGKDVSLNVPEGMDLGLTDPLFWQPFVEVQTPIKNNEKGYRAIVTLTTIHPQYSVRQLDHRAVVEYHHRTANSTNAPNFLFYPKSSKTKFVVSYGAGNVQTAKSLISSIEGNE